jgi:hypothetical protein
MDTALAPPAGLFWPDDLLVPTIWGEEEGARGGASLPKPR